MTLLELIRATLTNMETECDDERVAEMRADITAHLNEAYVRLCRERFTVYETQAVTAQRGKIMFTQFSRPVIEVVRVVNAAGLDTRFYVFPGYMTVGEEGYEYRVTYGTLPDELDLDDDVPQIPGYAHRAMADFAAYRMLMHGGRDSRTKGQQFFAQYLTEVANFGTAGRRIANKY